MDVRFYFNPAFCASDLARNSHPIWDYHHENVGLLSLGPESVLALPEKDTPLEGETHIVLAAEGRTEDQDI